MIDGAVVGLSADGAAVLRVLVAIHGDETCGGDEPDGDGRGSGCDLPAPRRGGTVGDALVGAEP
jgi:hypothetical protein